MESLYVEVSFDEEETAIFRKLWIPSISIYVGSKRHLDQFTN